MKYIDEFRDGAVAQRMADQLKAEASPERHYSFMEFCGGHTHALARYGVLDLLPDNIRMIHGPGCPVCVLPIGRVDMAITLALDHGVMLCTYGDVMRVPASEGLSLMQAKARGADIRMVYSPADALALARANPEREVVFLAIGFETTTPPTALVIQQAECEKLKNFSVLCCHVLTPSAITHILESPEVQQYGTLPLDGFVGPAHVSIIIGSAPYEPFARHYRKPVVIAGFEPLDVMQAILMLVRQVNEGRACVENQFTRAVSRHGNAAAQAVMARVFELRDSFEWRGLGEVPLSALRIRPEFSDFDAEQRFGIQYRRVTDHKQCECGTILRGVKHPTDCKLFGTVCTPDSPMGSCMVSSEGACAAHYLYGRFRNIPVVTA
ncbi:MAG: hydrogenase formation protein HypD [Gammaproteobacteria bacterium]|nr:hydrogenase formation protein HypD [Gammaproteobacteria bacterium]MBU0787319.1 hydrogenase formation protein HypD [Gammaproteobacteria bacterium]MBU0816059.1 hydrogenase formation protein HypD [Gammaproteobacteria bacterium]MBU1787598.1 hydrogenase formation protein HypD [Gammaproteobacteria bacterium]